MTAQALRVGAVTLNQCQKVGRSLSQRLREGVEDQIGQGNHQCRLKIRVHLERSLHYIRSKVLLKEVVNIAIMIQKVMVDPKDRLVCLKMTKLKL